MVRDYGRHRRKRRLALPLAALIMGSGIFVGSVLWFRSRAAKPAENVVMTPTNVRVEATLLDEVDVRPTPAGTPEQITLAVVAGQTGSGIATRVIDTGRSSAITDDLFTHTVKATLSPPPEGFVYEGWLVRPFPFDFFSTGTFDVNSNGEFVLVWVGEPGKDYADYRQVVVTLEPNDANPVPATHILEGEF